MNKLISILFFFTIINCKGQSDSLNYYFDDGGLSQVDNCIKVSATGFLSGEYALSYERAISNSLSIEAGAGIWTDNGPFSSFVNYPTPFSSPQPTALFSIKHYFDRRSVSSNLQGVYTGFAYRYRKANFENNINLNLESIVTNEILFLSGYQIFSVWRLIFDGAFGVGVAIFDETYKTGTPGTPVGTLNYQFTFNFNIKTGIRF